MNLLQICSGLAQAVWIIFKTPDAIIAMMAQKTTNALGLMAVIYREQFNSTVSHHRLWAAADSTHAFLLSVKMLVFLNSNAVISLQIAPANACAPIFLRYSMPPLFFPFLTRKAVLLNRFSDAQGNKIFNAQISDVPVYKTKIFWGLFSFHEAPYHPVNSGPLGIDIYEATGCFGLPIRGMPISSDRSDYYVGTSWARTPAQDEWMRVVVCEKFTQFIKIHNASAALSAWWKARQLARRASFWRPNLAAPVTIFACFGAA